VIGRHLHVGDDDVGLVRTGLAQQVGGVGGLRDDLDAALLEDADEPGPQQGLVFGDEHAQRIHAGNATAGARRPPRAFPTSIGAYPPTKAAPAQPR
jgi:hypothetical protein